MRSHKDLNNIKCLKEINEKRDYTNNKYDSNYDSNDYYLINDKDNNYFTNKYESKKKIEKTTTIMKKIKVVVNIMLKSKKLKRKEIYDNYKIQTYNNNKKRNYKNKYINEIDNNACDKRLLIEKNEDNDNEYTIDKYCKYSKKKRAYKEYDKINRDENLEDSGYNKKIKIEKA